MSSKEIAEFIYVKNSLLYEVIYAYEFSEFMPRCTCL